MRKDIHPDYHPITLVLTSGEERTTYSTWGKVGDRLTLEIDPGVHPAWTGGGQRLLERGRLARFNKRFSGFKISK